MKANVEARVTHTSEEVSNIEAQSRGELQLAGYLNPDERGFLIPIFLRSNRSQEERKAKVHLLNRLV